MSEGSPNSVGKGAGLGSPYRSSTQGEDLRITKAFTL